MSTESTSNGSELLNTLSYSYNGAQSTQTTNSQKFNVTAVSNPAGAGAIYQIDGVNYPALTLVAGRVYTFDQSAASNGNHPLAFRDNENNSWTQGVVSTGTPGQPGAQTVFTVPNNAPDGLRYYCTVHGNGMGDSITVLAIGDDKIYGTSQNDTLYGSLGDDIIYGFAGDDVLFGGDGNNTLIGGMGNDTLVGGKGLDLAVFAGSRNQYVISATSDGLIEVRDTAANRDGTDSLREVERIVFSDTIVGFDINGVAGKAYRIYQAAFDRAPDSPGLGYWINVMDNGALLTGVAGGFIGSDEFQSRYGNTSDVGFIKLLYENVLDRQPDAGGYQFWQEAMGRGLTREGLLVEFSESRENKANVEGLIANGIEYTPFIS